MTLALTMPNTGSHAVQFVWPIADDSMTLNQLVDEATPELIGFVTAQNASLAGPPMWTVAEAAETAGWETHAPGLVLIAVAPVQPVSFADDTDEVAVHRAIRGDRSISLTDAELVAAVRVGTERLHLSDREIGARLELSGRTVLRIRTKHEIPAALGADRQVIAA